MNSTKITLLIDQATSNELSRPDSTLNAQIT